MKPEKVTTRAFFDDLFKYYASPDPEERGDRLAMLTAITNSPYYEKAAELLLIRNETFDSSAFGQQSVLMCGPACTVKTAEDLDRNRAVAGDLPSQWKLPIIYCVLDEQSRRDIKEMLRGNS